MIWCKEQITHAGVAALQVSQQQNSATLSQQQQRRIPSELKMLKMNKKDPVMQQIVAQNDHTKMQQKTQQEFLYQYIKDFQEALAESNAYKMMQQQKLLNQKFSVSRDQHTSPTTVIDPQKRRSIIAKSELNAGHSRKTSNPPAPPQIVHQSDRYPFGVTVKIDDKCGFKGHKHVIDLSKQAMGNKVQVNQSYQLQNLNLPKQMMKEESIQSTLPQTTIDNPMLQSQGNEQQTQIQIATTIQQQSFEESRQPNLTTEEMQILQNETLNQEEKFVNKAYPIFTTAEFSTINEQQFQEAVTNTQEDGQKIGENKLLTQEDVVQKAQIQPLNLQQMEGITELLNAGIIKNNRLDSAKQIEDQQQNMKDIFDIPHSARERKQDSTFGMVHGDNLYSREESAGKLAIAGATSSIKSPRNNQQRTRQQQQLYDSNPGWSSPMTETQSKIRVAREAIAAKESQRYLNNRSNLDDNDSLKQSVGFRSTNNRYQRFRDSRRNENDDIDQDIMRNPSNQILTEYATSFNHQKDKEALPKLNQSLKVKGESKYQYGEKISEDFGQYNFNASKTLNQKQNGLQGKLFKQTFNSHQHQNDLSNKSDNRQFNSYQISPPGRSTMPKNGFGERTFIARRSLNVKNQRIENIFSDQPQMNNHEKMQSHRRGIKSNFPFVKDNILKMNPVEFKNSQGMTEQTKYTSDKISEQANMPRGLKKIYPGMASKTGVEWMKQQNFDIYDQQNDEILAASIDKQRVMMTSYDRNKKQHLHLMNESMYAPSIGSGVDPALYFKKAVERTQRNTLEKLKPLSIKQNLNHHTFMHSPATNENKDLKRASFNQGSFKLSNTFKGPIQTQAGTNLQQNSVNQSIDTKNKQLIKAALQNTNLDEPQYIPKRNQGQNNSIGNTQRDRVALTTNLQSTQRDPSQMDSHKEDGLYKKEQFNLPVLNDRFKEETTYQQQMENINTIYSKSKPSTFKQSESFKIRQSISKDPQNAQRETTRKSIIPQSISKKGLSEPEGFQQSVNDLQKQIAEGQTARDKSGQQQSSSKRIIHHSLTQQISPKVVQQQLPLKKESSQALAAAGARTNTHRSHSRREISGEGRANNISPPPLKAGQIGDFDIEHLLHPLRFICAKKMLCSCNNQAPRSRSPQKKEEPQKKAKQVQESMENLEANETAAVAQMLNKVEWKNTPVYKQHMIDKTTEADSLRGTQIGVRRYKDQMRSKGKSMGQIALDLKDEKLRKMVLDNALKNYYMEPEVGYLMKIVKNRNLNEQQMGIVYEKAIDTLEVLMVKLGLDDPFQKVLGAYDSIKQDNIRWLLLKVLTRCLVMYESLEKIAVIFKLMRRRSEMEQRFNDFEKNWMTGQKFLGTPEQRQSLYVKKLETLEQDVAQYCYQSCRLWVQINGFMIDHYMLNGFKFKFGGTDYQPLIREQVAVVRQRFGPLLGGVEKIPLMDEQGHLYYENDGNPQGFMRVGGGFVKGNLNQQSPSPSPSRKNNASPDNRGGSSMLTQRNGPRTISSGGGETNRSSGLRKSM